MLHSFRWCQQIPNVGQLTIRRSSVRVEDLFINVPQQHAGAAPTARGCCSALSWLLGHSFRASPRVSWCQSQLRSLPTTVWSPAGRLWSSESLPGRAVVHVEVTFTCEKAWRYWSLSIGVTYMAGKMKKTISMCVPYISNMMMEVSKYMWQYVVIIKNVLQTKNLEIKYMM